MHHNTFLLPNCTALIQPLDQNAVSLTKLFYRKSLLAHILSNNEQNVSKLLKSISLKDTVCLLHNAWEKVAPLVLQKFWAKVLPCKMANNSDVDPDDSMAMSSLRQNICAVSEELPVIRDMLNLYLKKTS